MATGGAVAGKSLFQDCDHPAYRRLGAIKNMFRALMTDGEKKFRITDLLEKHTALLRKLHERLESRQCEVVEAPDYEIFLQEEEFMTLDEDEDVGHSCLEERHRTVDEIQRHIDTCERLLRGQRDRIKQYTASVTEERDSLYLELESFYSAIGRLQQENFGNALGQHRNEFAVALEELKKSGQLAINDLEKVCGPSPSSGELSISKEKVDTILMQFNSHVTMGVKAKQLLVTSVTLLNNIHKSLLNAHAVRHSEMQQKFLEKYDKSDLMGLESLIHNCCTYLPFVRKEKQKNFAPSNDLRAGAAQWEERTRIFRTYLHQNENEVMTRLDRQCCVAQMKARERQEELLRIRSRSSTAVKPATVTSETSTLQ